MKNLTRKEYCALHVDEFNDFYQVIAMGAAKYKLNGWLDADGHGTSHKEMHASMFRHLACSSAGIRNDSESGLDHLLHIATRALMLYTRLQRSIVNPKDEVTLNESK